MAQRKPPGIVAEICNADAARSRFACLTIALHLKRQYKLLRRSDAIFARGEFRVRAVEQSLDLNVEKSFECDVRPCAFVFASCLVDKCASTDAQSEVTSPRNTNAVCGSVPQPNARLPPR